MANEKKTTLKTEGANEYPFSRCNFIGMAVAGVMIVLGFCLMLGPGSTATEFNPDIFSTRRLVVGPAIAFLGFVAMALAIVLNPAQKAKEPTQQ